MGEILSQAEVEAILASIEPSGPQQAAVTPPVANMDLLAQTAAWERHNFHQTEELHEAALKLIRALHDGLCQRWQARLQRLLQSQFIVRPVGACQSTTADFLASLGAAHVTGLVSHGKSAAESLLVWDANLVRSLVARMLGEMDGRATDGSMQPMTSVELRLLARLNEAVLRDVSEMLDDVLSVLSVTQGVQAVPDRIARFSAVWFSFEARCAGISGLIHIGVPRLSLKPLENGALTVQGTDHLQGLDSIPGGIQQVCVQLSASLACLKIKTSDLVALRVGDIVMTDLSPEDCVSLQLGGRDLCQATMGTHLGRKALRLADSPQR